MNLLRCVLLAVLLIAGRSALAQVESYDPGPDISPHAEQWRYSLNGGRWWYFSPERRWHYWSEGRWVEHLPPSRSNTPPYIQPPVPQRPVRRRWIGGYNAWRYNPAPAAYSFGPGYYGQPGFGVY